MTSRCRGERAFSSTWAEECGLLTRRKDKNKELPAAGHGTASKGNSMRGEGAVRGLVQGPGVPRPTEGKGEGLSLSQEHGRCRAVLWSC